MDSFGFIGLGIMGSAIAKNLIRAGYSVTVWNRSPAKTADLASLGAHLAETPRQVVEAAPVTFAMLADPAAAKEVVFGRYGVLDGIGDGRGYIDMSTVDPDTAGEIGAAITSKGGRFLEAPVSGSRKPAEEGSLVILAAGDRSLHDDALPAFEKIGKKIFYLGETGNGARMKLVVNMIMGGMMTVFCEGLALGEKAGLSQGDILEAVDNGAMANAMFRMKGGVIASGYFDTHFPLKHMQKDLRLAVNLGDCLNQPLPAAATANETFKRAKNSASATKTSPPCTKPYGKAVQRASIQK